MIKRIAFVFLAFGGFYKSQALELNLEPLGKVNLNGSLSGYALYTNNKSIGDRKTHYDIGSALLVLSKPAQPIGFTFIGGAYALPVVGIGIPKTSDTTELFSALPIAYLEVTPHKNISLQVGKVPTLIGYESAFTYLNSYIQRGLVWNMQPVIHNGIRLAYSFSLFSLKVGLNDGFYTLSKKSSRPALEGSIGISPTEETSLSFNFLLPDKSSKPNSTANPANKREFNTVGIYKMGALSFGLDLVYVEAPKDEEAEVPNTARASGGALHISYKLKTFAISGRAEFVKDNKDMGGIDLVGIGDGNKGWSFTLTPSYTKGPFFVKGEASYLREDKPFTMDGKRSQTRFGVEVGLSF